MMKFEFENLAGYEVSAEDYEKVIEPMYMATDLSKEEFVKTIDKKRFAKVVEKTAEQLKVEAELKEELKKVEGQIERYTRWIADPFPTDNIKYLKTELAYYKNLRKSIKWVLA